MSRPALVAVLTLLLILSVARASLAQVPRTSANPASVAPFVRPTLTTCSRVCDSRFSSGKCWKKSFAFFIDDFAESLLNFMKAAQLLSKHKDIVQFDKLELYFNETFEKFSAPFHKPDEENEVPPWKTEFTTAMDLCKELLLEKYRQTFLREQSSPGVLSCPRSKCHQLVGTYMEENVDEAARIRVLQVLTFFFTFTSLLMICVYLFMYFLVENRLIKSYKKL